MAKECIPLLGLQGEGNCEVFPVVTVRDIECGKLPYAAVDVIDPSSQLSSAEVVYDASEWVARTDRKPVKVFFHNCVFRYNQDSNSEIVHAAVFAVNSHFSSQLLSPHDSDDQYLQVNPTDLKSDRCKFEVSLQQSGQCWEMMPDKAQLDLHPLAPIVIFHTVLEFAVAALKYQFITRHVVLTSNQSALSVEWHRTEGFCFSLQSRMITNTAIYTSADHFSRELAKVLYSPTPPQECITFLQQFLHYCVYEYDGKPEGNPDYGKQTYLELCEKYLNSSYQETEIVRLRMNAIWLHVLHSLFDYYSKA